MSANAHNLTSLSDRLVNLAETYKADRASVMDDAKEFEVDTAALQRLASWKRTDATKRAEKEALDEQYRFLAGELPGPATLPADGELATAVRLFGEKMTVRQVAEEMGIAVGKAHRLKTQAAAFAVHVNMNVNKTNHRDMIADDIGHWLPPHDAETGEIHETALGSPPLPEPESEVGSGSNPTPSIMPSPDAWQEITLVRVEIEERERVAREAERAEREAAAERRRAEREALAARNREIDADTLDLPPFLDRRVAA